MWTTEQKQVVLLICNAILRYAGICYQNIATFYPLSSMAFELSVGDLRSTFDTYFRSCELRLSVKRCCSPQEGFRLLFFRVLRKAERVLNAVALTGADEVARMRSRLSFAYAAGLAFGAMSALFSLLGQLADALGPGTAGLHGNTPRRLDAAAITAATFRYATTPGSVFTNLLFVV